MKPIIVLILLLSTNFIKSQEKKFTLDTLQFRSEKLNEDRSIIIQKPVDLSVSDSLIFVYLLDGEFSASRFKVLRENINSTHGMMAIGIVNTDRRRDLLYSFEAGKFLNFLTEELIPFVEKSFQVKTRVIFGHSFAGSFVIYSLINKPGYFNRYIASSPTPIMKLVDRENYLRTDSLSKNNTVFYHSYGSEDMGQVRKWSEKLAQNLAGVNFRHLKYSMKIFDGKNHNDSDVAALSDAIKEIQ